MKHLLLSTLLLLFIGSNAFAKGGRDEWTPSTFDLIINPNVQGYAGTYEAGTLDEGKFSDFGSGFRAAIKMGPLLLGGEYIEGKAFATSQKIPPVASADRFHHPDMNEGTTQKWGWVAGLTQGRFSLTYAHYGYNKLKVNTYHTNSDYNFAYEGNGERYEASIRLWKGIYFSAHFIKQTFSKYSSTHPTALARSEALSPKVTSEGWGGTLGVILPISTASMWKK